MLEVEPTDKKWSKRRVALAYRFGVTAGDTDRKRADNYNKQPNKFIF